MEKRKEIVMYAIEDNKNKTLSFCAFLQTSDIRRKCFPEIYRAQ